jgi:Rap1a immunity proteins
MPRILNQEEVLPMKVIATCGAAAIVLTITSVAKAQVDKDSANDLLPGCKYFLNEGPRGFEDAYLRCPITVGSLLGTAKSEQCFGALLGSRKPLDVDVPYGVRTDQAMTVVVRYVEARPQRWHEPFKDLAIEALHHAWPCK